MTDADKRRVSFGCPSVTPPREQPEECRGLALLRSIDTVSHASISQNRLKVWKSAVQGVYVGTCVMCVMLRLSITRDAIEIRRSLVTVLLYVSSNTTILAHSVKTTCRKYFAVRFATAVLPSKLITYVHLGNV